MKSILIAVAAISLLAVGGCVSTSSCPCTEDEVCKLKEKKHLVICKCGEIKGSPKCCDKSVPNSKATGFHQDSIRDRMVLNHRALGLRSSDVAKLRKNKTVILCGYCGNLRGTPDCCVKGASKDKSTDFAEDSIRSRILGPYTD